MTEYKTYIVEVYPEGLSEKFPAEDPVRSIAQEFDSKDVAIAMAKSFMSTSCNVRVIEKTVSTREIQVPSSCYQRPKEPISVHDFMVNNGYLGGCDCYDEEFDMPGICMSPMTVPHGEEDTYDLVNDWILRNTELAYYGKIEPVYDTVGRFSKLVRDHLPQFIQFSNRFNNDDYKITGDDEQSIYNGVCTVHSLAAGYYGEEQYDAFMEIFALIPEGHVVYKGHVLDAETYLARKKKDLAKAMKKDESKEGN